MEILLGAAPSPLIAGRASSQRFASVLFPLHIVFGETGSLDASRALT